nr:hypothetical protein [Candidatus Woesearchaeota archaeon]
MEIISKAAKLSLEGKIREGLTLEELELLIKNSCDSFGLTPIDPFLVSNLSCQQR